MIAGEQALSAPGREYLEHLWWAMHHSYEPSRVTFALTSYLDDSGSDELSAMTAIGGPVMSKEAFMEFSEEWPRILRPYRIEQPLHLSDFVGPYGKHAGMYLEMKKSLFRDVSETINKYKLYSVSISVPGPEFDSLMPEDVRKVLIGPYAMAFFSAVLSNQSFSEASVVFAAERIAYLVDSGFGFSDQLVKAHAAILAVQKAKKHPSFVGALAFDSDDRVPALQAADAIAGAARRRELGVLIEEFMPLHLVLNQERHAHIPLPTDAMKMFSSPIRNWLSTGVMPSLKDILR